MKYEIQYEDLRVETKYFTERKVVMNDVVYKDAIRIWEFDSNGKSKLIYTKYREENIEV